MSWQDAPVVYAPEEARHPGKLGFVNRAIASTLGAPVDVVNFGVNQIRGLGGLPPVEEPVGGSASLRRGMRGLGADVAPEDVPAETYGERAAEGVGMAAGMLLPGAGMVGAASRTGGAVTRGVAGEVARPFISGPGRAVGAELAAGADRWAEETVAIADDARNDWMQSQTKDGDTDRALNQEHVQRSKLRIDTRKWIAGKLRPRVYGDRINVDHGLQENTDIAALRAKAKQLAAEMGITLPAHITGDAEAQDDEPKDGD